MIIDEINRANLPAVLGELIYALEYRGEFVESIYGSTDGNSDRKITLPKNLLIIGTMNTADRSVGHIDYAIRRRFAFKEMLPDKDVINTEKGKECFDKVRKLFVKDDGTSSDHLSPEFDWKDVQIGHSYFMGKQKELEMKLEYEVKPILREYLKDGILLNSAKEKIENLKID